MHTPTDETSSGKEPSLRQGISRLMQLRRELEAELDKYGEEFKKFFTEVPSLKRVTSEWVKGVKHAELFIYHADESERAFVMITLEDFQIFGRRPYSGPEHARAEALDFLKKLKPPRTPRKGK